MTYFELLEEVFPKLIAGLGVTMQMTLISLVFAMILGMVTCLFKISKFKILHIIASIYVEPIRGTPMLVQAFFVHYGITQALNFKMSPMTSAVITLSLNAGAYLSEIFRSGILAVNKGQMEAARSLGMPYSRAMQKIILPQAMRIVIPSIVNQFIITIKDTSILSAIGVMELVKSAQIIVARNFKTFQLYGTIGLMYFVIIFVLSRISMEIERRMARGYQGKSK